MEIIRGRKRKKEEESSILRAEPSTYNSTQLSSTKITRQDMKRRSTVNQEETRLYGTERKTLNQKYEEQKVELQANQNFLSTFALAEGFTPKARETRKNNFDTKQNKIDELSYPGVFSTCHLGNVGLDFNLRQLLDSPIIDSASLLKIYQQQSLHSNEIFLRNPPSTLTASPSLAQRIFTNAKSRELGYLIAPPQALINHQHQQLHDLISSSERMKNHITSSELSINSGASSLISRKKLPISPSSLMSQSLHERRMSLLLTAQELTKMNPNSSKLSNIAPLNCQFQILQHNAATNTSATNTSVTNDQLKLLLMANTSQNSTAVKNVLSALQANKKNSTNLLATQGTLPTASLLYGNNQNMAALTRQVYQSDHITLGLNKDPALYKSLSNISKSTHRDSTLNLYMACDEEVLSEHQILLRKQIEYFEAGPLEVFVAHSRKKEIYMGQVGIRCKHCAVLSPARRPKGATYYPTTLRALYQAAQNMATGHFTSSCEKIEVSYQNQLNLLRENQSSASHGGKKYWADCAKAVGINEMKNKSLQFLKSV